jgi:hypothetical protein
MSTEVNPNAPPSETVPDASVTAEPPLERFTLEQPGGVDWTLSFYPHALRLESSSADRTARTLDRRAFLEHATLNFFSAGAQLVVKGGPKPIVVKLSSGCRESLREWLGSDLAEYLRRTLRGQRLAMLLLGVLWLLPTLNFRLFASAVGVACLLWAAAVTVKPHRALLLASAVIWVGIDVTLALNAIDGSKLWLVFLLPLYLAITTRVRAFQFFRPLPKAAG